MKAATIILCMSALASATPLAYPNQGTPTEGYEAEASVSIHKPSHGQQQSSESQGEQQFQGDQQEGQQQHQERSPRGGREQSRGGRESYPSGMASCPNNYGFKYAVQSSVYNNQLDPQFWTFLPLSYWKAQPLLTGVSRRTTVDIKESSATVRLFDGQRSKSDNIVINMKGYLYTPETGTYTFTSSSGIKGGVGFVWINQLFAYKSYSRGVANLLNYPGKNQVATYTVDLKASQYVPIRVMYGHSTGDGHFDLKITSPSGKVLLGSNGGPDEQEQDSRYIIQSTCGLTVGNALEKFGDFGSEMF